MGSSSRNASKGATASASSPISGVHRAQLQTDFAQLAPVAADLPESVFQYVVEGTGADVLDRLAATPGCGKALGLVPCVTWGNFGGPAFRAAFFKEPPPADPVFFLRLARIYAAAAQSDRTPNASRWATGLPDWLDVFLWEATNSSPHVYTLGEEKCPFRAEVMEQMIVAAGEPADLLARATFLADSKTGSWNGLRHIARLDGFAAMAARHPKVISEGLEQPDAERRLHILNLLLKQEIDSAPFAARIVELAVCTQKTVRQAAETLLAKIPTVAVPLIRSKVESGSNDERALAAPLLWRIIGEQSRSFLIERLEKESSAKVKALIGELIIERASGAEPSDADLSLPPIAPVERVAPLSTKARAAFTTILREAWEAIRQNAAKLPQFNKVPPPLEEAAITLAIDFIEGAHEIEPGNRAKSTSERLGLDRHLLWQSAENFAARPDLALIHVVRLADLFKANDDQFVHLVAGYADKYYFSHKPRFSLRELAAKRWECRWTNSSIWTA
jgi:hypothetical protein